MDIPEVLKLHLEKTHADLDKSLIDIRKEIVEHGTRINAVEREIAMFKEHLSRIENKQEELNKSVNQFIVNVPGAFEDHCKVLMVQFGNMLDEKFQNCRNIQDAKNEKSFLKLPPGFWGAFIKVAIAIILLAGGFIGIENFIR